MLVSRSLIFYWRWHLGMAAGVAIAAMAIIGSFLVGDSVKETLRQRGADRVVITGCLSLIA